MFTRSETAREYDDCFRTNKFEKSIAHCNLVLREDTFTRDGGRSLQKKTRIKDLGASAKLYYSKGILVDGVKVLEACCHSCGAIQKATSYSNS